MADFADDADPERFAAEAGNVVQLHAAKEGKAPEIISFNRRELDQILRIYGNKVADGEWRDYAIDMLKDRAVFSVFKRAAEVPLYRIEKNPKFARKQGAWSITSASGQILKRGHELQAVLRMFESKPRLYQV
jgi:hypothetical protein